MKQFTFFKQMKRGFIPRMVAAVLTPGLWAAMPANAQAQNVCEIAGTGYADFGAAVAVVADGQTIKLPASSTYSGGIVVDGKNITIDLNNFNLVVDNAGGDGLYADNAGVVALTGAGAFNVTGTLSGVLADRNSTVTVTNATATAPSGSGVIAGYGSNITVKANAAGNEYGAFASRTSTVDIRGNASGDWGVGTDGGTVTAAPPYISEAGGTVTLTITPDPGYKLESITVTDLSNAAGVIPLSGTGATRTFKMPAHHVRVAAVFKSDGTGVETQCIASLQAYAQNGVLYVTGLTPGNTLYIYNIPGTLIYQGVTTSDKAEIALPGRGIYIVTSNGSVIKVANSKIQSLNH